MIGEGPNHHLGWDAISSLRNVNTFDYAMIGTCFWPYGWPVDGSGKIYILFGGAQVDSVPDVWIIGRTDSSRLATSLSRAGYITGINYDGIISGAPTEHNSIGASYLWQGGLLLDTIPNAWLRGIQYDDGIGWAVTSAGDVNGDGRDEFMVSNYASNYSPKKVWVCKYIGVGIEENCYPITTVRLPLEVYPNPARANLAFRLPQSADHTIIKVYDVAGKIVKTLQVDSRQNTENNEIRWDLRNENKRRVANGIYFVEVSAMTRGKIIRETKKVVITR